MRTNWPKQWRVRGALLFLPLALAATGAAGQEAPAEPRLRALAEAALRAEGRTIMSGDPEAALQGVPEADDIRGAMERPAAVARARNEANKQGGITVVRTTERIVSGTPRVSGGTATLEADVVLERYMSPQQGRPDKWVESGKYRFHYEQQDGANWRLVRYEEVDPFGLSGTQQAPGAPRLEPVRDTPSGTDPSQRRGRPKGPGQPPQAGTQTSSLFSYAANGTLPRATPAYRSFNWEAARSYARIWACPPGSTCYPNGNPNYRNFATSGTRGGDCTNFVSQALRAGGWTDLGGYLNYTSPEAWWYDSFKQSYTWVGAHYFYRFLASHPDRVGLAPNVWDLLPGDLLQIDFEGDGEVDHTMILTWRYETQPVQSFISYHTNNTLDRPLSDLLAANAANYPNRRYYGWWVYS